MSEIEGYVKDGDPLPFFGGMVLMPTHPHYKTLRLQHNGAVIEAAIARDIGRAFAEKLGRKIIGLIDR
jgi:hypothetical protein